MLLDCKHTHNRQHAHTRNKAYSPNERDHLLHNVLAEGDDHKQFLYDKEAHREGTSQLLSHKGRCWGVEQGAVCAS